MIFSPKIKRVLIRIFFTLIVTHVVTEKLCSQPFKEPHQLKTIFYDLDLKIDFKEKKLFAQGGMTITSNNSKAVTTILCCCIG